MSQKKNICLLNFGRKGCSPVLIEEFAKNISNIVGEEIEISAIISNQSDRKESFSKLGLKTLYIDTHRGYISAFLSLFKVFDNQKKIKNFLLENNVGVVFCIMSNHLSALLSGTYKEIGIKYITLIHEISNVSSLPSDLIASSLLKKEILNSDKIIALTDYVKKGINNKFKYSDSNIFIINHPNYNFSNINVRNIQNKKSINILFFGRIIHYKGLDILLDSWPQISKEIPNARLQIIGSGECDKYKGFIESRDDIYLRNEFIKDSEIGEIFEKADLLVVPYRRASQSGVISTAFGSGMPVVCTNVGGLSEQVKHMATGIISKEISSKSISESVIKLLRNQALYQKLTNNINDEAKNINDWQSVSKKILNVLCS